MVVAQLNGSELKGSYIEVDVPLGLGQQIGQNMTKPMAVFKLSI